MKLRTCDAAVAVLRETKNSAVMWGDERLLHLIAERAGLLVRGRAWQTSDAVLRNLSRQPGQLVRVFFLPEEAPARS